MVLLATALSMPLGSMAGPYRACGWGMSGMVVSDSRFASEAGVEVLREGGNVVDAAVTAAFALAVTYPWAGNLGGGGFAVVHPARGADFTLDFRETAPARARRDMFLDEKGNVVPGCSLDSCLAVGVPGSVDGLLRLWKDHGSGVISRRRILEPAIRLAAEGFPVNEDLARRLNGKRDRLRADEAAAAIFVCADRHFWHPGDRLIQKDLARTLERIARKGRDGFYRGETADGIAATMEAGGGLITRRDLAAYRSRARKPVRGTFRGFEIVGMGPPSSGGILLIQLLNMVEDARLRKLGWNSASYVHLLTEAERRAFADRAQHLGDPDFWPVPVATLISKAYARRRMNGVSLETATPSSRIRAGVLGGPEPRETTHLSVADALGNAVSLTTTLNAGFGSCIVARGTGVLLNDEMDDFSAKPGAPNLYGLVGNEANAIAPGKRMLSSMSPTIVLRDGRPFLVLGSPGGSRIITAVFQVILNVLVFDMPIDQAVAVPRVHSQWLPDEIVMEPFGLAPEVVRDLRAEGHQVRTAADPIGRVNAIQILPDGLHGGPDVRGACAAAAY